MHFVKAQKNDWTTYIVASSEIGRYSHAFGEQERNKAEFTVVRRVLLVITIQHKKWQPLLFSCVW